MDNSAGGDDEGSGDARRAQTPEIKTTKRAETDGLALAPVLRDPYANHVDPMYA